MTSKNVFQKVYKYILSAYLCICPVQHLSALEGNAGVVADYLADVTIKPFSELAFLLEVLDPLDPVTFESALNQLQPSWYEPLDWSTENSLANARLVISNNLLARVREYKCSSVCEQFGCVPFSNFWLAFLGGQLKQERLQKLPAFRSNDFGVLSGIDFVLADWLTVGVGGGYSHTDLRLRRTRGNNSIHNFYIGPYFAWNCGRWAIEASILKGWHRYFSDRHIHIPLFRDKKQENTHYGSSFLTHLGSTLNYCWGALDFQPFISADYIYIHVNGFRERHANNKSSHPHGLGLRVKRRNVQFFQGEVGGYFSATFTSNCAIVVPTFKLGFQNITPFANRKIRAKLQDVVCERTFNIRTTTRSIYQGTAGFFLNFYIQNCPELSLSCEAAYGDKRSQSTYTAELDWSF